MSPEARRSAVNKSTNVSMIVVGLAIALLTSFRCIQLKTRPGDDSYGSPTTPYHDQVVGSNDYMSSSGMRSYEEYKKQRIPEVAPRGALFDTVFGQSAVDMAFGGSSNGEDDAGIARALTVVRLFIVKRNAIPDSLDQALAAIDFNEYGIEHPSSKGVFTDSWGNPLRLVTEPHCAIVSAGPDGVMATSDDVRPLVCGYGSNSHHRQVDALAGDVVEECLVEDLRALLGELNGEAAQNRD